MSYKFLLATVGYVCRYALQYPIFAGPMETKRSFDKSAFSNFKSLPANKTAGDKTVKGESNHNLTDGRLPPINWNGYFTDIFGAPVSINGANNPVTNSGTAWQTNSSGFGVNMTNGSR